MFIRQGKTNWIFIVIVALIAGAVGGGLAVYINDTIWQTDLLSRSTELKSNKIDNSAAKVETAALAIQDNGEPDWSKYKNDTLGFSITIPKRITSVNGCNNRSVLASLETVEDNANNVVYLVPEHYFEDAKDCPQGKPYSLQIIKDQRMTDGSVPESPFLGAAIRVGNMQNDTQIDQFIKKSYGSDCKYKKTLLSGDDAENDSVYSITAADATYGNSDLSGCGLRNGMAYRVLYYPRIHKIIGLVLGQQECGFYQTAIGDEGISACFDQLILSSIKFNE